MAPETDDTKPLETAETEAAAPATDAVASPDPAPEPDPAPTYAAPQPGDGGDDGPSAPAAAVESVRSKTDDHPEFLVLGAFAGGLVLATILKRLGS